LAVLFALFGCRSDPKDRTPIEERLVAELGDALAREIKPNGHIREYELVAAPAEVNVAGESKLRAWAYNGSVPGPTLRVRLGETLRVKVTNQLPQETTVHWHGVRVPNAMDGVPYLTQAPIKPGETFVYEYTPKDAGTYWYHPHLRSSEQVERGLYGVLIVEDEAPPPYDHDVIWVLDDWRLGQDRQIDPRFNTRGDLMHDGRWGNVVTVNGRTDEVLKVRAGERVRLRLLNTANGRVFVPSFGELSPKIIAVDGKYLARPIELERFELAPGNRLDLDLEMNVSSSARFEVRDLFSERRPNRLAAIEIDGLVEKANTFASPARARVPAWQDFDSAKIDKEINLDAAAGGPLGIAWRFNGVAHTAHDHHAHPPLMVMEEGAFHRLRFVNKSFRLHPIHLHGMFFRLLVRNGRSVDEPFFRDTVLIHAEETIDIGVVPFDAGRWMMHCHVLEHAEAGMMSTFEVRSSRAP
jgi:FtsP/CotA-like multicopper oxidase with cupredoxin domain